MSLLLTCKVSRLLVNTLGADEKFPVFNRDNLAIPIQMLLCQKQKIFLQFSASILKSSLNFNYFTKKYEPHRFSFSEMTESEKVII